MMPGVVIEDLAAIFPCELVNKLQEAHNAAREDFSKAKVADKEARKLERQKQAAVDKTERTIQAAAEQMQMALRRLEDLKRTA